MTAGVVAVVVVGTAIPAAAVTAGLPAAPTVTGVTGLRPNATRLSFKISDRVAASVDVATGNLNVTAGLLSLVGITGRVPIGVAYNSMDSTSGSGATSSMDAASWTYNLDGAGSLSQGASSTVVWTASDGATWVFTPKSGSTTLYTSPGPLMASLAKTSTGWDLTEYTSQQVISFDSNGNPTTVKDRNGNVTTIGFPYPDSGSVVSNAGPSAARTASFAYSGNVGGYGTDVTTVTQSNGSSRNVQFKRDSSTHLMSSIVDAMGQSTQFSYNASKLLSKIVAPGGAETDISYDSSGRVVQVDQLNTTAGSPGTSTTRVAYPSSTQTLVAGPDTSTASAVSAVPHITYTIDSSSELVTGATDQMNRTRSKTYNPGTLTVASSSIASDTTTNTYGANAGLSQTKTQSPGGATQQAAFGNTGSAQYLPSSTTDSAGNQSTYTYNGAGNLLTSQSPAVTASASLTYNSNGNGTVVAATAPGNSGNPTKYGYDANWQLNSITPPTGTTLGARALTYDAFGRLASQSDGRGITTSYTYDKDDRLLTTSFSDSTPTVTNTWSTVGELTSQAAGSGTITNTYDQLGRLLTTVNSAGGDTETYGWDKASNQTTLTDSRGTSTNAFDASGVLLSTTYPKASGTQATWFKTDDHGRRTDAWLQTNSTQSVWAGHQHTSYDTSGRVSEILAQDGPATGPTTVLDITYSYDAASTGTTCASTAPSGDRSKLQSTLDKTTGQTTIYCYDKGGRLTKVAQSGGSSNTTWTYGYDANGNRTTATATGGTTSSQTLTFNAGNQITSSGYSYDGAGNLTASPGRTYTYNGAEQMTNATVSGTTTTYTYAGASQNAVLSETGGAHSYQLTYGRTDPQGNPEITAYKVDSYKAYVEDDPVVGQANMLHTSADIACLYIQDGIDNPVALLTDFNTTAYTYTYDPYGLPTLTSGGTGNGAAQNPYMFKNGVQDRATGFVKFGTRWYNPVTGTWTQQDTLDSPLDPANANRYAYAGDDPINNFDPSGVNVTNDIAGLLVGILAGAACEALTVGIGTVGCAIIGGLLGLGYTYALNYLEGEGLPTL